MELILNILILIILNAVFYKILGVSGIILSFIIFFVFNILVVLLTAKIINADFEEFDLYEINKIDIFLYKIIGKKFLIFRKKYETKFDTFYFHINHFVFSKLKIYSLVFIFSIIISVILFNLNKNITIEKIEKKQQTKTDANQQSNNNQTNNQSPIANNNTNNLLNENSNNNMSNNDESFFLKQHIIISFKKKYGPEWKDYLYKSMKYYKDNNITNDYTKIFIKPDGTIEINEE